MKKRTTHRSVRTQEGQHDRTQQVAMKSKINLEAVTPR